MGAKLSGSGGGKYSIEQNAEINVTPFVDVMLVLLIIFMVAAPLASVTVEVVLPPAYAPPSNSPPKPVYVSIKKDGSVFVGDEPSSLDTLSDDIMKKIGVRTGAERMYIRGDSGMRYKDFMGVMNKLQDNGYYQVALVGEDKNAAKGK